MCDLAIRGMLDRVSIELTGIASGSHKRAARDRFRVASSKVANLWASVTNPDQSSDIAFAQALRSAATDAASPSEIAQERMARRLATALRRAVPAGRR